MTPLFVFRRRWQTRSAIKNAWGEVLATLEGFEEAHRRLGEHLGFLVGNVESQGSPDPWWYADNICLVFEDHAGASPDSELSVSKARQVTTHPNWVRDHVDAAKSSEIVSVLVTPVTRGAKAARSHLKTVALWPLDEFRAWANRSLSVIREIRRTFHAPGDLAWRTEALSKLKESGIDARSLAKELRANVASESLNFGPVR